MCQETDKASTFRQVYAKITFYDGTNDESGAPKPREVLQGENEWI
jgi:hypothetical protein